MSAPPLARVIPSSLNLVRPGSNDEDEQRLELMGAVALDPAWRTEAARLQVSIWDSEGQVLCCDDHGLGTEFLTNDGAPLPFNVGLRVRTSDLARAARLRVVAQVEATQALGETTFEIQRAEGGHMGPQRVVFGQVVAGLTRYPDATDMNYELLAGLSLGRPWRRMRVDMTLLDQEDMPIYADDSRDDPMGFQEPLVVRLRFYMKLALHARASHARLSARVEVNESSEPVEMALPDAQSSQS